MPSKLLRCELCGRIYLAAEGVCPRCKVATHSREVIADVQWCTSKETNDAE